jgi:formylglycine-generating enzyme required for sulfatase activity
LVRSVTKRLAGAALIGAACSCAQITGLSDLQVGDVAGSGDDASTAGDSSPGGDSSGTDTSPPADGATSDTGPPPPVDGSTDTGAHDASGDSTPGPCVSSAGPALVAVGSFCVDSTEVTNDQYTQFLAASPPLSLAPAPACSYKASFTPSTAIPVGKGTNPVVFVDWCDAYAYCAWAGKHLCGAIGGGQSSKADAANKNVDEWYVACSADGANVFPYGGNTYVQGKCNDSEAKTNGTRPVGSFTGCKGGYPGLVDMNGNAYEWEDACEVSAGASDGCLIRGGSWGFSGATYGGCNTYFNDYTVKRSDTYNDTGFRCCVR